MKKNGKTIEKRDFFTHLLRDETTLNTFDNIIEDNEKYLSFKPFEKAKWWIETINRLEKNLGKQATIQLLETCGQTCYYRTYKDRIFQLIHETHSFNDFLHKLTQEGIRIGRINDDTFSVVFDGCYCDSINMMKNPKKTSLYCHCSIGFIKELFTYLIATPSDVYIKKTILRGDDCCKFFVKM